MNSKQVNYYITENELEDFDDYLASNKGLVVGLPMVSSNVVALSSIKELNTHKFKWPLSFRIVQEEMMNEIRTRFVEKQGYYLIDTLRSPVIEMSKCYFDTKTKGIRIARLYYQTGYYDENEMWVKKNDTFIKWADNLLKEFKNKYVNEKVTPTRVYISKDILKMITDDGWRLIE